MTADEAIDLCRAGGIPWLVPHHFGMFASNTVNVATLTETIRQTQTPRCVPPDTDHHLLLEPSHETPPRSLP